MQFQIACRHCRRPFAIEAEPGRTLRCNCPYCGEGMTVATPAGDTAAVPVADPSKTVTDDLRRTASVRQPSVKGRLVRKVTVVFFVCWLAVILLSTLLYVIFSSMSN